ncbi:MAG: hypothetical protein ACP5VP_06005 [Candidatus Limnocylindrales bacterium]
MGLPDVAASTVPALVPERALTAGLSNRPIGTHTGKTMMLAELRLLLAAAPGAASFADYQRAAVKENALAKSTAANRANTLMYLKQLYGLRPDIPVFAAMRELWEVRSADQPLLALLCACARDILLRATAEVVLSAKLGAPVRAADLSAAIAGAFPDRYAAASLRNLGRNIASSWTQAGLLAGTRDKHRATPSVDVAAVVYALYLGHLEGYAGPALFSARWARLLGRTEAELRALTETAARAGWLEYRSSGGMTEITFRHLDTVTGWVGA